MSAARNLTDADVAALAKAIVTELAGRRAAEKKAAARDEDPVPTETDRAAARAYARRLGYQVRVKR